MSKKRFVEFYLTACLRAATGGQVARLSYILYDLSKEEAVVITFAGGHAKEVHVTGDSLVAIASDVLRVVCR